MDLTIKAQARGAWGVVIGPTLVFLLAWVALPVGVHLLLPSASGAAYGMAVILGLPLAGVLSVVVHRAFFRHGQGRAVCLVLRQDRLQWRRHGIDLNQPYRAVLRVGSSLSSGTCSLDIRAGRRALHLFSDSVDLLRLRSIFREGGFLLPGALGPEQGAPVWVIDGEDALQLLSVLWRQRHHNGLFQVYLRYPWDKSPVGLNGSDQYLAFESPAAQADLARAIYAPKPKEIWLTPEALLFREANQIHRMPLGQYRLESVSFGESSLRWFAYGGRTFWLDPNEDQAEVEFLVRYVNRR